MDNRIELQKDDRLLFPGMECAIDYSIGRGSNVIAYVGRYRDHHNPSLFHRVLVRELFPYDPDGRISRCPDGSIRIDPEALPLYDLNRRTFQRGNEVHLRLLEENPSGIDLNINTFEYNNTLYSLVGYTGGRNLYEELGRTYWKDVKTSGTDRLLHIVRMMKGALGVLQTFHRSGFLHLDISPDNILLIGEGETERVTLIDYNSVHTLEEVRGKQPVYYSTKDGFTAPEVVMGRHRQIREWTDLYSMTAVLYLCLTGRKLSPVQMVGIEPISVKPAEVPLLKDCQETVLAVLRQILRRGLAVTPGRRYQNASQMLVDMTELEDRIEGRGITHWALWEAGRERIRRALKDNKALDYVMDDKKIYPLFARTEEGKQISVLQDSWFDIFGDTKKPILLLGGGGMGKTTALLRIGHTRNVRYTAASPAIYYISLYDYKEGDTSYICDRLLESLKFKPHTDSMESARQELMHLLDQPLRKHAIPSLPHSTDAIKDSDITQSCADISRENERPSVLLLLDGLNEASGDTASLLEEIHRLSDLAGVQIILTSRSDPKDPLFRRLTLCRIDQTEVRRILSEEGILPPENMEVMDLLSFPLLLSIYIRAVHDGGKQLRLESREQLLDDYFDSILEKEKRNLPDDTPVFMGILAAVRYLLPEIAAKTAEKRHALSEKELYSIVEKCYSELSKKAITSVYPDWIGHTPELRLGARTADEWYGKAVREILWKRLGLLVCDEKGHFRILHQMIEDYLTEKSRQFHEEFDREKRRQKNWRNAVIAAALISVLSGLVIYFFTTNRLLEQRQQDILRNESLALAYSSEAKLRDSDRNGAISDALSALPSEENKRPYVAEAEKALTDALYVYEDEKYHPSSMIRCENEIINCTVSDDGEYFIALDEFGQVCCYSTSSADMIWKKNVPLSEVTEDTDVDYVFNQTKGEYERETPEEPLPYLRILKKQNAVLYAGDYEEAILFYLNTGEELWRIPYDMAEINKFNPIKYMDVSEDESILVIAVLEQLTDEFSYKYEELYDDGFSYVEYLMNFDYNRILYFYDLETGNLLTKSEPVPVPSRYSCNYSGTGSFIKNGSAYVTVFFDWEEEKEYLVETDVYSGASVLLTTNDRTWTNFNARGIGKIEEIKYTAVDGETEETGLVYYYCQYEAKYEIGISGDIHLGFYSMRENKWLFFREYSLTGTAAEIPDILFYRNNFFIVSGNNIRCLTLDGNEELSYFDRKIVYCAEDAEAGCIVLAFEDGTAGIFDLSSKSFKGAGSSTYVMTSHLIRSSSGSGIANGPFCAISQEDPKTAIVFQYYEMDKTVLEQPLPYADEWEEEFDEYYKDDRGIYAMPEGEGFVQVSYYYYFELDNIGDDHSYVIIYNSEGEAIQTFQGYYFGNDAHFTTDGKKLYWDEAFVSLDEEKIYRIRADVEHDTSYPEHDGTWTKLHSSSMEGEVLSAYWKNGSLYTFISGEEQPVRQPPDTCVYDGLSDLSYYGSRNLVAGNNGLIILLRCDSSVNSDSGFDEYRTDKYQIYSVKNDQWYEIENASAVHGFPYVAAAEKKPWFVSLDDEGELLLYDVYSESLISRWQTNVVRKALSEIQFIMNDEYLLIQSDNGGTQIRIIRCSDGSTVFSSTEGNIEENHYSNYFPQYDSRNDRLYLVDEYGYGVGICIDTKSWTSLFRIENLRCVLNNNTFIIKSPDDEKIVQCKGYDLETLIRKAVQHPK